MDAFNDAEAALGGGSDFGSILGALRMLDPAAAATGSTNAEILQQFNVNEGAAPSAQRSAAAALSLAVPPSSVVASSAALSAAAALGIDTGAAPVTTTAAPITATAATAQPNAAAAATGDEQKYPWSHQTGIRPKVQNVVSMFNLGTKLDLKYIALHANNAEYNPKRFAAVIMRVRDPKTTALIFESGKVVVTGAENEDASKRGSKRFAKIILKLGFAARFKDFAVQNLVGSCAVPFPLRLEMLAADYAIFSSYEPELFPGLIFRMENPKVVLLIFVSGKIVLTGARNSHQMFQAFENIYPVLRKYSRTDSKDAK